MSHAAKMPRSYWAWDAMLAANANGFFPTTLSTNLLFGLREALRMISEEGLAFCLARSTHAPRAVGLFENGVVRDSPAGGFLVKMSDGPNVTGAVWCTEMREVMGLMQAGRVTLGFIGGAQVDRFGNLNTTYVGGPSKLVRLPGSGGAADIASLAQRHVVIMAHERRRFVERVDYVTSPGHGTGGDWRARTGLPGGGPAAVITTLGVFRFDPVTREMVLASVHPVVTVDQVRAETGWALRLADSLVETLPPRADELAMILSDLLTQGLIHRKTDPRCLGPGRPEPGVRGFCACGPSGLCGPVSRLPRMRYDSYLSSAAPGEPSCR